MLKIIFLSVILSIFTSGLAGCASSIGSSYGRWEKYSTASPISFPDFNLYYEGRRLNGVFPGTKRRLADIYVFKALKDAEAVEILWSSGTGLIGPKQFSIGGQTYMLEMFASDILGRGFVSEENIAVWRIEEFEALRKRAWWMFW